jgi:hypothetical protein
MNNHRHLALARLLGLSCLLGLAGCARVLQKDREYLSDPIMQLQPDPLGAALEGHNQPRREGSAGGGSGSGGGCGC